ncbi:unnamed protein product [Larinioides sclopetarius]|uniref:Uncharacterized protein n=1 Tax=Larinioides sclopetarius TaxID=280406 RepID=A0AAV2B408_9ARAC
MEYRVKKHFPWLIVAQRAFLNSFDGNYEVEILEWLQRNIAEDFQKVQLTHDLKIAKIFLKGIEYFYNHFCRIWRYHNQFSSRMESTWVYILSTIIKTCLFLSQGMKESKWIKQALNVIKRFPGEKHLIYDALLLIHSLDFRHKPAYAVILKTLFMDMPLFVPVIIDDPTEFLKVYLLVRRLKLRIKNKAERAKLYLRASKILAPPSLWDWLLENNFNVPWTRKGIKKVNLGINIDRKLGGTKRIKILKKLRKILLPGLCTKIKKEQCVKNCFGEGEYFRVTSSDEVSSEDDKEIKTKIDCATVKFSPKVPSAYKESTAAKRKKMKTCVSAPCTDQILSEDEKEEISVKETKVKNKKLKRKKQNSQEDGEEGMTACRLEMQRPVGNLDDDFSEENAFPSINHNSTISNYDNDEFLTEKKSKKRRKSVDLEENEQYNAGQVDLLFLECSSESVNLVREKIKRRRKLTLNKMAEKILNRKNEITDKDSCLVKEVMEQPAGGRKQREMVSEKKQDYKDNCDSKGEPKSKRKEKSVAEEDNVNVTPCDHSLHEDISHTADLAKSRRKKQKRQRAKQLDGIGQIAIHKESDAVVVAEIPCDHSLHEDISHTSVVTKSRRKRQKRQRTKQLDSTEEIELISIHKVSDAPVVVAETYANKAVPDEETCPSKGRIVDYDDTCSDKDRPVVLKELNHCSDSDPNSSKSKKNKDSKEELKSNPGDEAKITDESIFVIDSEPSQCLSKSGATQITYDTIYGAQQKDTSTNEISENINNNGHNLNSSNTLADLQDKDLPPESDLRLKVTDKSYAPEEAQGSCASNSSDLHEPIFEKEIRKSPDNQISRNVNGQDCKCEDGDNVISATMEEHTIQIDGGFLQDSAEITENVDCSLNQKSGLLENCESIKSDLTSEKLMDGNEKIPVRTDFEKVTIQKTNNSPEAVSLLESHGSSVSVHSSLNSDGFTQAIEMQKNGHPSIETDERLSVTDKVNCLKASSINTKTTENNDKVFVKREFPFKNNSLTCEVKKKERIQENRVSESLFDSPLKTDEILLPNVVNISSPEKMENNCTIKINSEAPLENSISNLLENKISLNCDDSSQEIVIKEEKLTSNSSLPDEINSEVVSDSNSNSSFEIDSLEVKRETDNTNIEIQRPSQNNFFYARPLYQLRGLFIDAKSPIFTSDPLDQDSERLPNHQIYDPTPQSFVSEVDTPNSSAAKAIMGRVLIFAELAGNQDMSIKQNINDGDFTSTPHSLSVNNLFLTPSVENEKPTECLSFSDISIENVGSLNESQSFACHTPESSEFLQYRDLFNHQDDNRSEDTLSENKSILKTDGSECPSDTCNDSEDDGSNSSSRNCYSPETVPDASNCKTNCETYVVKTECSWDDAITRQRFCMVDEKDDDDELEDDDDELEDDDEHDTRCSGDNQTDISTKMMQLKGWMLNPVVNLGERCDSKRFVDINASVSADSLSIPINSSALPVIKAEDEEASVLPVIKAEEEEINVAMPFDSKQSSLTVDNLSSPVNETGRGLGAIEQSMSIAEKREEIFKVNNDAKIEMQSGCKDVKEQCLATNQKLVELSDENDIHDHEATEFDKGPKSPFCDKDQETVKLKKEKEFSQDHKIIESDNGQELTGSGKEMELRNRFHTEVKTENSMSGDESSNILNQDAPPTPCMNLQSANLSSSTNQGRSASDDEGSSLVNQNTSASPSMNLRSRNSSSSSQEKYSSDNKGSSVVNQDTSSTLCMNLRNRNPLPSSQGKSIPADEDSNVFTQDTPATRCMNLRSRNPSASSIQEIKKRRSQTITKRSSKRLKKEVPLDFDFSELSLNSPKAPRGGKRYDSSNKNSSKVVKNEPPTSDHENPCRRVTRASVISSTADTKIKEQDTDPDGYNLRSRKSVIMPGKLKL